MFDCDSNYDLHLKASDGLPNDTWKLESAGSSSKYNVLWSYDLHRMAESHQEGDPRLRPDCHAIVAGSLRDHGRSLRRNQYHGIEINGRREVHDQGLIATRSWPGSSVIVASLR